MFVSKSEVASWPASWWLPKATGRMFIERSPNMPQKQTGRFSSNDCLIITGCCSFPKGTSTTAASIAVQEQRYFNRSLAPEAARCKLGSACPPALYCAAWADPRFLWLVGDHELLSGHLVRTLASARQGKVTTILPTRTGRRRFRQTRKTPGPSLRKTQVPYVPHSDRFELATPKNTANCRLRIDV